MGLYSGGVQIIAGTDAGIDNCPHDAYISVLSYPGAEPAVAGPAAAASALATPAGPSPR
jgi:hypothetical protein